MFEPPTNVQGVTASDGPQCSHLDIDDSVSLVGGYLCTNDF